MTLRGAPVLTDENIHPDVVRFLGEQGHDVLDVKRDGLVLPAGVAYPEGQDWDMNTGKLGERLQAERNIAQVPIPASDPVYGDAGPLVEHWRL